MNKEHYTGIVVILLLILSGCSGISVRYHDPPGPVESVPSEPYVTEAEQMALCLSGELRVPEELFDVIISDLVVIRRHLEGTRYANVRFRPRWHPGCVMLVVDDVANAQIYSRIYNAWNGLHGEIGPVSIEHDYDLGQVKIWFADNLNVEFLVYAYMGLPGILDANFCSPPSKEIFRGNPRKPDKPGCSGNIYLRWAPEGIEYLFGSNCRGDSRIGSGWEHLHIYFVDGEVHSEVVDSKSIDWETWL